MSQPFHDFFLWFQEQKDVKSFTECSAFGNTMFDARVSDENETRTGTIVNVPTDF